MPIRQDGRFASLDVMRPRETFSRNTCAAKIQADHVKCVLTHIHSDGGHCVNGGCARHGGAPSFGKPPRTLRVVGGGSAAGPSHSRHFAAAQHCFRSEATLGPDF